MDCSFGVTRCCISSPLHTCIDIIRELRDASVLHTWVRLASVSSLGECSRAVCTSLQERQRHLQIGRDCQTFVLRIVFGSPSHKIVQERRLRRSCSLPHPQTPTLLTTLVFYARCSIFAHNALPWFTKYVVHHCSIGSCRPVSGCLRSEQHANQHLVRRLLSTHHVDEY